MLCWHLSGSAALHFLAAESWNWASGMSWWCQGAKTEVQRLGLAAKPVVQSWAVAQEQRLVDLLAATLALAAGG